MTSTVRLCTRNPISRRLPSGIGRGASQENGRSPIDVNLVVIDDPQRELSHSAVVTLAHIGLAVTPLIPLVRRDSPRTKIIFRSHIESGST